MIDSPAQPPGGRGAGCWPSPQSVRAEQKSREAAAGLGLFLGERAVGASPGAQGTSTLCELHLRSLQTCLPRPLLPSF